MSDGQSFAEMFGQGTAKAVKLETGQKVSAEIVRIGKDWTFVDIGGKSEGSIATGELVDADGNPRVAPGDKVELYFLGQESQGLLFTTKISGSSARLHLEDAYRSGIPVEGHVTGETKGGFSVNIAGNVRAFCPYSQMDIRRVDDPASLVGTHLSFRISEYSEQGRNIIISRRALLEEERLHQKDELRQTLKEGDPVRGVIRSVHDFGAFLDIGGIDGLIPASEISWGHDEDVRERVSAGQEIDAVVLKLDWDNDRYSFSLKQALPDPWRKVAEAYPEGSGHQGTISRLINAGAFVSLEPGIDGFLHISKLGGGKRLNHPREAVSPGDVVQVIVEKLDTEKRRMSLALPSVAVHEAAESPGAKDKKQKVDVRGDYEEYKAKQKGETAGAMGTLGDLLKGKLDKRK